MPFVVVYGTLRRGGGNARLLAGAPMVRELTVRGRMHSLGGYPAVTLEDGGEVRAELYKVDDATLARLDRLEGAPKLYQRTKIRIVEGDAWIYTMAASRLRRLPVVESGDWNAR